MARPRDVVFHLQIALQVIGKDELQVDGLLGPETYSAFHDLEDHAKELVRSLYVEGSPFLRDRLRAGPPKTPTLEFDRGRIDELTTLVAKELDVPRSYLQLMVRQENWVDRAVVKTTIDGTHKGIAQFNSETWETIRSRYSDLDLPDFESGVKDPESSLFAAAALYLENLGDFEARFASRNFTDGIAYLFHQQGTSAAIKFLREGELVYDEQSEASVKLFRRERQTQFV